jgi:hypothetical protein
MAAGSSSSNWLGDGRACRSVEVRRQRTVGGSRTTTNGRGRRLGRPLPGDDPDSGAISIRPQDERSDTHATVWYTYPRTTPMAADPSSRSSAR